MFSRSIIDDFMSINDTSKVVRMTTLSDTPRCGIILMTLEVSYRIVIFFIIQASEVGLLNKCLC